MYCEDTDAVDTKGFSAQTVIRDPRLPVVHFSLQLDIFAFITILIYYSV